MPLPSFRAAGTYTEAPSTSTQVVVPMPAGTATGDLHVLVVAVFRSPGGRTIDTPSGWLSLGQANDWGSGTGYQSAVFYRVSPSAAPGDVTVTISGGQAGISAQVWGFKDIDTSNPIDGSSGWGLVDGATVLAMPLLTVSIVGTCVIYVVQDNGNNTYTAAPGDTAKNVDQPTTQSNSFVGASGNFAAGRVAGRTWTRNNVSSARVLALGARAVGSPGVVIRAPGVRLGRIGAR